MTNENPMMGAATADAAASAAGGATIADRFKLDMSGADAKKPAGGGNATFAVVAGLIALGVTGILTYILWQHWAFLMPA